MSKLSLVLVSGLVGVVLGAAFMFAYQTFFDRMGWREFSFPFGQGMYSFSYPKGYTVANLGNGSTSDVVYIAKEDPERSTVMLIEIVKSVHDARITFSLPGGQDWEYMDEVMESFRIKGFVAE